MSPDKPKYTSLTHNKTTQVSKVIYWKYMYVRKRKQKQSILVFVKSSDVFCRSCWPVAFAYSWEFVLKKTLSIICLYAVSCMWVHPLPSRHNNLYTILNTS